MCGSNADLNNPKNWKYSSPEEPGFHTVISPDNSDCDETWIFRLNLKMGKSYTLIDDTLELNGVVIEGVITLEHEDKKQKLEKKDSFYLPAGEKIVIEAEEDSSIFIGGGPCEGEGNFFIREYDPELPEGDIYQVHGEPPYQRDVFITVNQEVPASRLICGLTWGEPGKWTSWPPHQHSEDLEEVYCFFDIPPPKFAMHLSSRKPGVVEEVHTVSTGDCVVIPEGYHPTVGMPGVRSCYFWVMVAHSRESRRYDLAVNDPNFE